MVLAARGRLVQRSVAQVSVELTGMTAGLAKPMAAFGAVLERGTCWD